MLLIHTYYLIATAATLTGHNTSISLSLLLLLLSSFLPYLLCNYFFYSTITHCLLICYTQYWFCVRFQVYLLLPSTWCNMSSPQSLLLHLMGIMANHCLKLAAITGFAELSPYPAMVYITIFLIAKHICQSKCIEWRTELYANSIFLQLCAYIVLMKRGSVPMILPAVLSKCNSNLIANHQVHMQKLVLAVLLFKMTV